MCLYSADVFSSSASREFLILVSALMLAQQAEAVGVGMVLPSKCGIVGSRAESAPVILACPSAPGRVSDFSCFQQGFLGSARPFQPSQLSKHMGVWEGFRKQQLSEMLTWKERRMMQFSSREKEGGMLLG